MHKSPKLAPDPRASWLRIGAGAGEGGRAPARTLCVAARGRLHLCIHAMWLNECGCDETAILARVTRVFIRQAILVVNIVPKRVGQPGAKWYRRPKGPDIHLAKGGQQVVCVQTAGVWI